MRAFQFPVSVVFVMLTMSNVHVGDEPARENWIDVGGDSGNQRYSTLDQIRTDNVHQLREAWTYHTGELDREVQKTIECTPLIIEGVMYITTGHLRVVALDAVTGEELWEFDPFDSLKPSGQTAYGGVNRGVAWWSDGQPNGKRQIFHGTSDGRLFSLDAKTGALDPDFGTNGVKDLREDLEGDMSKMPYGPTFRGSDLRRLDYCGLFDWGRSQPRCSGRYSCFRCSYGKSGLAISYGSLTG